MNPTAEHALANLRDIHTPDAISLWPIAPGWYGLAVLILLIIVGAYFYYRYWKKHKRYRRQALKHLDSIYRQASDSDYLQQIAELIKHTAMQHDPSLAKQSGKQWQQFLEQAMPADIAKTLAVSRYQQQTAFDKKAIYQATQHWIKAHR